MKYERITERDEYGNADIIDVDMLEMFGHLTFTDLFRVTKALNRLAELEDKIEDSTLVELPCKIGDKLYYVNKYTRVPRLETYDIRAIGIADKEPYVRLFVDKDWLFFGGIDEDVFFNREAAEARLKELEENVDE